MKNGFFTFEAFMYNGMALEPLHDSLCDSNDIQVLENAGFTWNSKNRLWICEIDDSTNATIKYKSDKKLWTWRVEQIKKSNNSDWEATTKYYNSKRPEIKLEDCLGYLKRFLLDKKIIQ